MIARSGWLLWAWLPVLLWMALILSLSSQSDLPIRTNPQTGETIRATFTVAKLAHVVEYSVLALLLLRALMTRAGGLRLALAPAIISTVLTAAVFGGLDELRQSMVPNREPRLTDVALDTASALGACVTVAGWFWLRRPRPLACSAPQNGSDSIPQLPLRHGEGERRSGGEAMP
jgi:VanZ family protein